MSQVFVFSLVRSLDEVGKGAHYSQALETDYRK